MTDTQQGDVLVVADVSATGLEFSISALGGVVAMTGDFRTAVALSLFGGDSFGPPSWLDLMETQPARMYPSKTLRVLAGMPATASNLLRLEAAAFSDLAWLKTEKIASTLDVEATIPALNRVALRVDVLAEGVESSFLFLENWKATV